MEPNPNGLHRHQHHHYHYNRPRLYNTHSLPTLLFEPPSLIWRAEHGVMIPFFVSSLPFPPNTIPSCAIIISFLFVIYSLHTLTPTPCLSLSLYIISFPLSSSKRYLPWKCRHDWRAYHWIAYWAWCSMFPALSPCSLLPTFGAQAWSSFISAVYPWLEPH